jgi:hypothetical protein
VRNDPGVVSLMGAVVGVLHHSYVGHYSLNVMLQGCYLFNYLFLYLVIPYSISFQFLEMCSVKLEDNQRIINRKDVIVT